MQKSDWREEILNEKGGLGAALGLAKTLGDTIDAAGNVVGGALAGAGSAVGTVKKAAQTVGKAISGRNKTASQKRIIKTGGIKAARDRDGDGKLEKYNKTSGDYSETLLYDVVHDYIISENFASDTEGANKVMLKLSDELMEEIYERTMTAAEKRKDTMLKKKYDDSDMKKNMQGQYGKEEGKKVYFATIRKQAMEEVIPEAKYEAGASNYGKMSIRNKRAVGYGGNAAPPEERRKAHDERMKKHKAMKEEVGIATHSMMMKDKAKKEAMLRMKERDAVAKKLRKEEVKRDEYGDPIGGPKISKKQLKKNLAANTPDEDHTNTTAEGYGSDRVGPALTMARAIDKVNPRPKPNSKRTAISRALKMASIKKDEKIRKRKENPYSTDKKLKMVASSIRDRVKRKVKSMAANEDYIPEEGYDQIKDRIAMAGGDPSSPKKMDATKYPVSKEIKNQKGKTVLQKQSEKKYGKGKSALDIVKADIRKKHGKGAIMSTKK